ncbi:MAG: FAD-dependent oxidoreductase [Pseudomonadales bacterium]|nr:FAD-dependent oxidoreductase [Pseudomonadales bacterium]
MYDIIVVGAGSAGCAIAARASEHTGHRVLLVEAGPDYPDVSATPFDLVNSHNNSYRDHDWGLSHAPTQGRSVPFPRGRVTGGSSAVNTTIALRGVPEDYDDWAAAGNPEWAWEAVLPAFRRLERDLDFGAEPYHGDAGPIAIRRYRDAELLPQHQAFLAAAERLGYRPCADANDPWSEGAGPHPMNKLGRLRVSCALGYLAPARVRANLEIRANTLVRRLIVERGRCRGIEVEATDGSVARVDARLVVLAAGAIMSPAILLRSGIGAPAALGAYGIELVADMPGVGANLSDHPALAVVCRVRDPALVDFDQPLIQTILRYTAPGSGLRNDLQIEQLSFSGRRNAEPRFAIAAVLEYQHGRGELRLASADPHAAPVIENRFCEDPRDVARLTACLRDTLAFARSAPLADMIDEIVFPDLRRVASDEDIAELCRRYSGSGYHPCGTARMGPASDAGAVVDQYGCCHGVDALVVADASIMPAVPRANTNLTCIMIGERVGEWLRTEPARYGL